MSPFDILLTCEKVCEHLTLNPLGIPMSRSVEKTWMKGGGKGSSRLSKMSTSSASSIWENKFFFFQLPA